MAWEGKTDPIFSTKGWKALRKYWRDRQHQPCWRCGKSIDYSAKYPHPLSLVVGHVVGRGEARDMGWPEEEIHTVINTRPEHKICSDRSGSMAGRLASAGVAQQVRPPSDEVVYAYGGESVTPRPGQRVVQRW